jgi:hypothetical protein
VRREETGAQLRRGREELSAMATAETTLKDVLDLLGLPASATIEDVRGAIRAKNSGQVADLFGLPPNMLPSDVADEVARILARQAGEPAPDETPDDAALRREWANLSAAEQADFGDVTAFGHYRRNVAVCNVTVCRGVGSADDRSQTTALRASRLRPWQSLTAAERREFQGDPDAYEAYVRHLAAGDVRKSPDKRIIGR